MPGDRHRRSFPAMGKGKRVVAVHIAQFREIAGKLFIVGIFAGIKAQVLEQDDFAVAHLRYRSDNVSSDRRV